MPTWNKEKGCWEQSPAPKVDDKPVVADDKPVKKPPVP
jgi:hypothetical protein